MHRFLPPRFIVALGLAALFESYLLGWLFPERFRIDVWIVLVVFYALFYNVHLALPFALVVGFFRDCLGYGIFGVGTVSIAAVSFVVARLATTLNREQWYVQMFIVWIACLCFLSFELGILCALKNRWVWFDTFGPMIGTRSLATALAGPLLLKVMQKWLGRSPTQYELFP